MSNNWVSLGKNAYLPCVDAQKLVPAKDENDCLTKSKKYCQAGESYLLSMTGTQIKNFGISCVLQKNIGYKSECSGKSLPSVNYYALTMPTEKEAKNALVAGLVKGLRARKLEDELATKKKQLEIAKENSKFNQLTLTGSASSD